MTNQELLDLIGEARGIYIQEAQEYRILCPKPKGRVPWKRMVLMAAILALALVLVGCAVAYVQGWFVDFFSQKSEIPLSYSQISYIQEHEKVLEESKVQNGWTVTLGAVFRDGDDLQVMFRVTSPEGVTLEPQEGEKIALRYRYRYDDGQSELLWGDPEQPGTLQETGNSIEDGDGRSNTGNFKLTLWPKAEADTGSPGMGGHWKIRIENIVRLFEDEAYKQHLLDTKYKGDYGVMFTHEESQQIHQEEILAEGPWEFTVSHEDLPQKPEGQELLTDPIRVEADILRTYGMEAVIIDDMEFQRSLSAYFREDITLTSIQVQPLSVTISYTDCDGNPNFRFPDENALVQEDIDVCVILQNGRSIPLRETGWGVGNTTLSADTPVIWEDADHILFADGTKVYMDGRAEYPRKAAQPAAAAAYRTASSENGVFAYYADFDGDGIDDMAVWYDGCFHSLSLLNAQGETRKEIPFVSGMDIYETYYQRTGEICYEPDQIGWKETVEGIEYLRFYRATETGLELTVGVKFDPSGTGAWFRADPEGTWEPITEEAYRRIVEDYQIMNYRLRPIE